MSESRDDLPESRNESQLFKVETQKRRPRGIISKRAGARVAVLAHSMGLDYLTMAERLTATLGEPVPPIRVQDWFEDGIPTKHLPIFAEMLAVDVDTLLRGKELNPRAVEFGKRLREIRKYRGLTLQELAAAIGKKHMAVFYYEIGATDISLLDAVNTAKALDVSLLRLAGANSASEILTEEIAAIISKLSAEGKEKALQILKVLE